MIVATAGHIDHGKTSLVKVLTGVDTDRLPQEKARGISIDLGFAYWRTPDGTVLGFVDVPGHERFVRNMLAGVCGIDFVLLVVAADDGPMPQTLEHLNIVRLLGIRQGLVALTKADRVTPQRITEVTAEVRALLQGTALQQADVLPVSSISGAGIDALRSALVTAAAQCSRRAVQGRRLRYAIDRAFTVPGSGTVVTGTVFDGRVSVGERLLLSPSGLEARVRGIQKDGTRAESAEAGERCAINLAGIELAQVQRGDWLLDPALHAPSQHLDVEIEVLASEQQPLRHWTPVHLHIGTRDVTGRVLIRRGESLAPGQRGPARLVVDHALSSVHGERFILRCQSAQRTLGGGRVLDALPGPRRLPHAQWLRRMRALGLPDAGASLAALLDLPAAGVNAHAFARNFNLDAPALQALLQQGQLSLVGSGEQAVVLTQQQAEARTQRAVKPAVVHNPEHLRLWQLAQPVLQQAARAGLGVAELAEAIRAKPAVLRDMLHQRASSGETVAVTPERFYLRSTMDEFAAVARAVAQGQPQGRFTLAQFRDQAGIGRALCAHVLEALDRLGLTQRVADARVMRARPATDTNSNTDKPLNGAPSP